MPLLLKQGKFMILIANYPAYKMVLPFNHSQQKPSNQKNPDFNFPETAF